MVTLPHDYDAFCGNQKKQLPPIAWALPKGSEGRQFTTSALPPTLPTVHSLITPSMSVAAVHDHRLCSVELGS